MAFLTGVAKYERHRTREGPVLLDTDCCDDFLELAGGNTSYGRCPFLSTSRTKLSPRILGLSTLLALLLDLAAFCNPL